jgi:hypothetical protein
MKPLAKRLLTGLLVAAVLAPLALAATFFLTPLWRWVEVHYGIEAIGHSGPATWCFGLVYGSCLLSAIVTAWLLRTPRPDKS